MINFLKQRDLENKLYLDQKYGIIALINQTTDEQGEHYETSYQSQ